MAPQRLLAAAGTVGVALVLAGCGGSESPRPDLVVVSTRDGDYALYAMNADGSAQTRLTDADEGESSAETLFFQIDPAWSPDGRRLAFASKRGGSFDVFLMNADGTGSRRLTSSKENETHPTWSADGRRLAFLRGGQNAVWIMNADGTGARRLTSDTAEEADPAWSPDGEWIAYTRRTPGTSIRELWLVDPDDGASRKRVTSLGAVISTPAWSPDSRRIAFATDVDNTQYDIYTVSIDSGGRTRLTVSSDDTFEPAWSPDGTTIAYSEGGSIYATDPAGEAADRLTDASNNDSSPAWNPIQAPAEEE